MSKNEQMVGISRRTLVKSTAIGSLALAAGGFSVTSRFFLDYLALYFERLT